MSQTISQKALKGMAHAAHISDDLRVAYYIFSYSQKSAEFHFESALGNLNAVADALGYDLVKREEAE